MRESVIYQEILQELQQVLQQGLRQGKLDTVMILLTSRIGTIAPELQARVQTLSMEKLDQLCQSLLDFSDVADLTAWLQAQPEIPS